MARWMTVALCLDVDSISIIDGLVETVQRRAHLLVAAHPQETHDKR